MKQKTIPAFEKKHQDQLSKPTKIKLLMNRNAELLADIGGEEQEKKKETLNTNTHKLAAVKRRRRILSHETPNYIESMRSS